MSRISPSAYREFLGVWKYSPLTSTPRVCLPRLNSATYSVVVEDNGLRFGIGYVDLSGRRGRKTYIARQQQDFHGSLRCRVVYIDGDGYMNVGEYWRGRLMVSVCWMPASAREMLVVSPSSQGGEIVMRLVRK